MKQIIEQKQDNSETRLPYTPPDLVEAGNIAELTQSTNSLPGPDGTYS